MQKTNWERDYDLDSKVDNLNERIKELNELKDEEEKPIFEPTDYKLVVDSIQEMNDYIKYITKTCQDTIYDEYGLNNISLDAIISYSKEEVENMERDNIINFLNKYKKDSSFDYESYTDEELKTIITNVKLTSSIMYNAALSKKEIEEDAKEITSEYLNYLTSNSVRARRYEILSAMKDALRIETNEVKKRELELKIANFESSLDFTFILDRISKLGKKEIKNIVEGYFDERKSKYILEKFNNKIERFGYNTKIYLNFFNIEENFLPEEYKPFNNLFLFIYIRTLAYSDPEHPRDRMFGTSLTSGLSELIYHKFVNSEEEQKFINIIKEVLNNFMEYTELFKEKNASYEKHPKRIEAEEQHQKIKRENLIKKINTFNLEYDDSLNNEELEKYLDEEVQKLLKKQNEEYPSDEVDKELYENNGAEYLRKEDNIIKVEQFSYEDEQMNEDEISSESSSI